MQMITEKYTGFTNVKLQTECGRRSRSRDIQTWQRLKLTAIYGMLE